MPSSNISMISGVFFIIPTKLCSFTEEFGTPSSWRFTEDSGQRITNPQLWKFGNFVPSVRGRNVTSTLCFKVRLGKSWAMTKRTIS